MKVVLSPNFETPLVDINFLSNHGQLDNPVGGVGYGKDRATDLFGSSSNSLLYSDENKEAFESMGLLNRYSVLRHQVCWAFDLLLFFVPFFSVWILVIRKG